MLGVKPHRFLMLCALSLWLPSLGTLAAEAVKPAASAKPAAPAVSNPAPAKAATPPAAPKPPPPPVKPPPESELRAALTKSLGFLAVKGDEWMADQSCNSCHHMPELIWSHREAKRRGFAIDEKKFDEWVTWSTKEAKKPIMDEAAFLLLALPERASPEWVKIVASAQKPDGSWTPGGQFTGMQKRGVPDAQANTLRVSLLALGVSQRHPAIPEAEAAQRNAAPALQKKEEPTSLESLLFRILYADAINQPAEAKALRERIVKFQRRDGGWSSYLGENMSDPLATGQALYALQPAVSEAKTADAIARAQKWLLKTQREDGSWPIDYTHISKIDRSDDERAKSRKDITRIYTFWGSSWATLGLLQALPVKEHVTAAAAP
jgi:squalene-hopene/tetraprenyl-beta-curcumene cyclase